MYVQNITLSIESLCAVKVAVCLQAVSLQILPAVLVFKDGTYYTYSGENESVLCSNLLTIKT